MRPVLICDVLALARLLHARPKRTRRFVARRVIKDVEAADRYRLLFQKSHPLWGDGTISARALMMERHPEPCWDCPDYLGAIALAASALQSALQRRSDREVVCLGHRTAI